MNLCKAKKVEKRVMGRKEVKKLGERSKEMDYDMEKGILERCGTNLILERIREMGKKERKNKKKMRENQLKERIYEKRLMKPHR